MNWKVCLVYAILLHEQPWLALGRPASHTYHEQHRSMKAHSRRGLLQSGTDEDFALAALMSSDESVNDGSWMGDPGGMRGCTHGVNTTTTLQVAVAWASWLRTLLMNEICIQLTNA